MRHREQKKRKVSAALAALLAAVTVLSAGQTVSAETVPTDTVVQTAEASDAVDFVPNVEVPYAVESVSDAEDPAEAEIDVEQADSGQTAEEPGQGEEEALFTDGLEAEEETAVAVGASGSAPYFSLDGKNANGVPVSFSGEWRYCWGKAANRWLSDSGGDYTVHFIGPTWETAEELKEETGGNTITIRSKVTIEAVNYTFTINDGISMVIKGGGTVTLEGGRNVLESAGAITVNDGGSLTIRKSEKYGGVSTLKSAGAITVNEGGTLNIEDGEFDLNGENAMTINNGGTVNIKDGEFYLNGENAMTVNNGGTVNIKGGEFDLNGENAMTVNNGGTVNIAGGNFDLNGKVAITVNEGGTLNINDGELNLTGKDAITVNDGGSLTVNGGTITGKSTYYSYDGNGIVINKGGSMTMNGGTYIGTTYYSNISVLGGSFTMNGGTLLREVEYGGSLKFGSSKEDLEGKYVINGGEIRTSVEIYSGSELEIRGGTFAKADSGSGDVSLVKDSAECTVKIYGGTFGTADNVYLFIYPDGTKLIDFLPEDYMWCRISGDGTLQQLEPDEITQLIYPKLYNQTQFYRIYGTVHICEHVYAKYQHDYNEKAHDVYCTKCLIKRDYNYHTYAYTDAGDGTHKKTCTYCGYSAGSEAHSYDTTNTTNTEHTCTLCGASGSHSFKWTKTDDSSHTGVCSVCGYKTKVSHSFGSWESADGTSHTRVCSVCGYTEKVSHSFGSWESADGTSHTRTCSVCGYTEKVSHSFGSWESADDASHTRVCSVCGYTEKGSHSFGGWESADGTSHIRTCSTCSYEQSEKHSFGEWTKKDNQNHTRTCSVCGSTETASHDYKITSDATTHTYTCTGCKDVKSGSHTWDSSGKCTVCGTQTVAAVTTGGTTTFYSDISSAWSAAQGKTATVKLFSNQTVSTLTIQDSSTDLTLEMAEGVSLKGTDENTIQASSGTLRLKSGTVSNGSKSSRTVLVTGNASFVMDGGTVTGRYGIRVEDTEGNHKVSLVLNGGTVRGEYWGISVNSNGYSPISVEVHGGTVSGESAAISYSPANAGDCLTVTGGTMTGPVGLRVNASDKSWKSSKHVQLQGGSFSGIKIEKNNYVTKLKDFLASGYGYYDESGNLITEGISGSNRTEELSGTITVKKYAHQHSYDGDGYCSCGNFQPAVLSGGVYEIGNAGQLAWFSALVKGDTSQENITGSVTNASGVLTTDIDLTGKAFYPIGNESQIYRGTFDGRGHSVTLALSGSQNAQGLFGVVGGGTLIQNTVTKGSVTGGSYVGGLVGMTSGTGTVTVRGCGNEANVTASGINAAGIIATNMNSAASMTITDCYNTGTIKGGKESAAISAWLGKNGVVSNCHNVGSVTGIQSGKSFARFDTNYPAAFTNCYQIDTVPSQDNITSKSAEVFASGEITYLLNNGRTGGEQVWFQDIDNGNMPYDAYPVFAGGAVYQTSGGSSYSNTENKEYVSVDVAWGAMAFTWSGDTWNTDTHSYGGGSWKPDGTDGNQITVVNNGNTEIQVQYSFSAAGSSSNPADLKGSFTDAPSGGNIVTGQTLAAADANQSNLSETSKSVYLNLTSARPSEDLINAELGTVTVTIGGDFSAE